MSETLTVTVTQEDIDNGEPLNSGFCPIALAIKRIGYQRVTVDPFRITTINDEERARFYRTPPVAVEFIREFDDLCTVAPFAFTVDERYAR